MGFFASGRCWFTFIFRTTGLRAVEDFVRGVLRTLMGHTLTSSVSWALLPIPHFYLDYSTHFALCHDFFLQGEAPLPFRVAPCFTSRFRCCVVLLGLVSPLPAVALAPPWSVFIIAQTLCFVKHFFYFFFGGQACLSLFSFPPRAVPTLLTRHRFYNAFLRFTTLQAWSINPRHRGEDLRRLSRLAASLRVFSYPASPSL